MNNIYVEGEFLNHCNDCPFYNIETEVEFVGYEKNYYKCLVGGDIITGNCPLKPLADRLAEERKKVVQEIKKLCEEKKENGFSLFTGKFDGVAIMNMAKLYDILDQVERGE